MKHYVVMCDCTVDSMGYDETHVTAVKHSRDEARMVLKENLVMSDNMLSNTAGKFTPTQTMSLTRVKMAIIPQNTHTSILKK